MGIAQDVAAVRTVQDQLEAFQREMARDGQAQRSECRKLVAAATKRAEKLVDSTLQVRSLVISHCRKTLYLCSWI